MKSIAIYLFLLSGLYPAAAAEYTATGKVQKIFALDSVASGSDASHILVAGFSTAGTCPRNDGLIVLAFRDDEAGRRQVAVALSAKLTDQTVVVRTNDSYKGSGGLCYLRYLELN